jgi:hypothetical protein
VNSEPAEVAPEHDAIHGFCSSCGFAFDLREGACPRCQRCPACRSRWEESLDRCRKCQHPADPVKLAKLAQRLDPELAANRKWMARMEESWLYEQQGKRLNKWKLCGVFAVYFVLFALPFMALLFYVRVPQWIVTPSMIFVTVGLLRALVRQTRLGRFQWLLKDEEQATAKSPGAQSEALPPS